ncbi:GNAT family N-acetyltransferase [Streptomyces griseoviridis]|uniref:GNAT superfamily N-acetyltransferase n=1 Tax=Streptomyces griseoviridis TaxID=45398 RepID=A0ABT9LH20_STRGD|nr:GNAT family N-acetyltransferase [Streptomyces griseoviridis]MDP9682550.1 GNAT superfamily N-acetyltransferase [Streptomyces griseoviridis]GGS80570.1 acetyltransferase [Streptomyces griseoviridis]
MWTEGGEQVESAVAGAVAALRTAVDRDWEGTRAAGLEWSVRDTAVHVAECLVAYAGQLTGRAADSYVPFELVLEDGAGNDGTLRVVEAMGGLLTAAVRTTPREVRAFHPYPFRSANRDGFAAMGVAEVLLHTHDMARALDVAYTPPADLCAYVLTRIFPHVRPAADPWATLLWATGRGELPGRAPVTAWKWCNNLVLDTERLTLEGVTPAAASDLSLGGDGGLDWAGDGPADGTRVGAGLVAKAYEAGTHRPQWGTYALVRRADGLAVGAMGFHDAPDEDGRVEIGYDLVPAARGHGYATEALRALSAWALEQPGVSRVLALVEAENLASRAVVGRAGFRQVSDGSADGQPLAFELRR